MKELIALLLFLAMGASAAASPLDAELVRAADAHDVAAVRRLLSQGADVNGTWVNGYRPLLMAMSLPDLPLVRLLLDRGADPNGADDFGNTPLTRAVTLARTSREGIEVIRLLLDHGADIHKGREKALRVAAEERVEEVFLLLLERGANPNARDDQGCTPMMKVAEKGTVAMLSAARSRGADLQTSDAAGEGLLSYAARGANLPVLRSLLEEGADPRQLNGSGETLLIRAPLNGFAASEVDLVAQVKLLLAAGVNVNARDRLGRTALVKAVTQHITEAGGTLCHPAVVEALLEGGADPALADQAGNTPLHLIVAEWPSLPAVARMLLDRGADPLRPNRAGQTPIERASQAGYPAQVELLAARAGLDASRPLRRAREQALVRAAATGRLGEVKEMLELGTRPDCRDGREMTPLMHAATWNHPQIVRLLLEEGADPRARKPDGSTPLLLLLDQNLGAPDQGVSLVEELLRRGASVDAVDGHGQSALIKAACHGNQEVTRLLLHQGVRVDWQDAGGRTALMVAAERPLDSRERDRLALVRLLLQHGASRQLRDAQGRTALDYAAQEPDVVKLLESWP